MKIPRLRLSELLRQLGAQTTGHDPEQLVEVVSPCIRIGDLTEHVPPLLAPRAFAGGNVATTAARFAAAQLTCKAPGGLWVKFQGVDPAGFGPSLRFAIRAPGVLTASNVATAYNYGDTPVSSPLVFGDIAAQVLTTSDPSIRDWQPQTIFLHPGEALYVEGLVAASNIHWFFQWQEFLTDKPVRN